MSQFFPYAFDDNHDARSDASYTTDTIYLDDAERVSLEYVVYLKQTDSDVNVVALHLYLDMEPLKSEDINVPKGDSIVDAVNAYLPTFLSQDSLESAIVDWQERVSEAQMQLDTLKDVANEIS